MDKDETVKYSYQFKFADGTTHLFEINLTHDRMHLVKEQRHDQAHEWIKLGYSQCSNCTLDINRHKYCPVAESLEYIIETFKNKLSIEIVEVYVTTPEREIRNTVPIQRAIASLMGLYMATCGCPILDKLAPMAKFHLPFATLEETMYRIISNYLVAQYFIEKEGGMPDYQLDGLRAFYEEVEEVNLAICERVRSASIYDANVNAVVRLDVFAQNITNLIDIILNKIKPMYRDYIDAALLIKKKSGPRNQPE